jgi:hypothetical protein
MDRKLVHWIAIAGIACLMILDHLPERAPEMLLASLSGESIAVSSDWESLPIMYE